MIIRSLIAAFLLLLVLLVVLGAGILGSTAGTGFIVGALERQLEPRLTVSGLKGSLLSDLCADSVRYEQPGVRVRVEQVCVAPNLWSSLDFLHVSLQSLDATAVVIETFDAGEAEVPSDEPFALPLGIVVEGLRVGRLEINGLAIDEVDGALDLGNRDVSSTSSFSVAGHRVTLKTGGPWDALRADVRALGVRADGVANVLDANLPFRVSATAAEFDLGPWVDRPVGLSGVELSGSGDLHGYRFDVHGSVDDPAVRGEVRASGRGDWSGMALTALRIADAEVKDAPVVLEEVTGRVDLDWSAAFTLAAEDLQGRGMLLERAFRTDVPSLQVDAGGVAFHGAGVRFFQGSSAGLVHVDGQVDERAQIALEVRSTDFPLTLLTPDASGTATLALSLSGPAEHPNLLGHVNLAHGRYREREIETLSAEIDGTLDAARLTLDLNHEAGALDGVLAYRRDGDGTTHVDVNALELRLARIPAGARLLEPVRLTLVGSRMSLARTCLELFSTDAEAGAALDAARLCGSLDYPDGGLTVNLDPWQLPRLGLPAGGVSIRGVASASARLSSFDPLVGRAEVQLYDLVADHEGGNSLDLGRIETTVQLDDTSLVAELHTPPASAQELLLNGRLSGERADPFPDSRVAGEVYLELDGIWAAQSLLPMDVTYELGGMQGVMAVQAGLDGTIGDPLVNGVVLLKDVGAVILALNARFSDFDAEARLVESRSLSFSSQGAVGSGTIEVSGELADLDAPAPRLTTRFHLDGAELVDLPDYSATVSGDFTLGMGREDLALSGELTLDRADIRIADVPESAVSPSSDEVLVGEESEPPTQQIRTTDVRLTLGKNVQLEAFGLRTRLVGSLRLEEAPRRLQSVTGTISLREGEFEAYGQVLKVERGRLSFTGPVDNPTVDVEATKTVTYEARDYKISLVLSGTARDLVTTIRSQPALAEDDALALLLTGKTISQITTQEQSNVSGAALSMGLLNAMGVTQNVATRLNLEEIIVDQDDEGNMEFGAAVRLNQDFYLRYTYGVFSRLGGVLLRYRLNSRLSVQAKTGDAHSIEIRYGVD